MEPDPTSEPPIPSLQVRLPPLTPRTSAMPRSLVSAFGSLFATIGNSDAVCMLQWHVDTRELQVALPEGGSLAMSEDWDSAPCVVSERAQTCR